MCQFRRVFVCVIATFCVSVTFARASRKCTNVKEEYSNLQLGLSDAVPDEPIIGIRQTEAISTSLLTIAASLRLQRQSIKHISALYSFLASGDFSHLLITFANTLDPDQDRQSVGPDLDPNCLTLYTNLQVCSKTLTPNEASCCSRDSEMQYILASEKFVMARIQSQNSFLKTLISQHMFEYKEKVMTLVHHAENQTGHQLTDWYTIPWSEHRLAISNLFVDIEDYLQLNHVTIPNSVSKFFDDIFPVIFKNTIYYGTTDSFTHHYHHCLVRHRKEIRPHPFGDYPDRVARNLNSGLTLARAYLEALSVVMETINTTDSLFLEDECKHAVTRMQYCSHCHGFINVKPCKGFCLDVMRGCLSKMAEIGPEWSDVISSVETLVREMSEKSIEEVFKNFVDGISDAMMHSMVHAREFYQQVHTVCDIPTGTNSQHPKPVKNGDVSAVSVTNIPVSGPLSMDVMKVTLDLLDSKGMYTRIADNICEETIRFEQDPLSGTCWNGTSVSVYLRKAVDLDILSQARNNQEVKVSLVLDPKLRVLKDKLSSVNLNLQSHTRKKDSHRPKSHMVSDDPIVYASGDDWPTINIGTGTTLTDDEDLFDHEYGSGSGSGQGEDDINIGTGPGNPVVDIVLPDQGTGNRPYEADRGGDLSPDRPPQKPDPRRRQSNNNNNPAGAAVSVTVCLSLLLSTVLISIVNWRR